MTDVTPVDGDPETNRRPDECVAAVDLGSNTIKMTLGRRTPAGDLAESGWASATVRLGAGLAESGRLSDDRMDAAIATLGQFAASARDAGATALIGVATEATRAATNGPAFLERVRAQTGWDIQVISGDREAELTFLGVSRAVDIPGHVVIADIGGASTEIIIAREGRIASSGSWRVGSGSLTDQHVCHDPPTAEDLEACRKAAEATLSAAKLADEDGAQLIAVGGTGEYLARLVGQSRGLRRQQVQAVLERLTTMPARQLAVELGIPEMRAHVLPAGIAVVQVIDDLLGDPPVIVAPSGIRTGLLMETLGIAGPRDGRSEGTTR